MTNFGPTSSPEPAAGRSRGIAIHLLKASVTLIVIAAVGFAARGALQAWHETSDANRIGWQDIGWSWLWVSAALYALSLVPSSLVLSRALASLHQPVSLPLVVAAQLVGHVGKYVPGKAMVIILRASILNRGTAEVSIKLSAIAVIIETLNLIAVGAALSTVLVIVLDAPEWLRWVSGLMALGATIATLPPVLRFALSLKFRLRSTAAALRRRSLNQTDVTDRDREPLTWDSSDLLASWIWCTISWVFTGLSMAAVVAALVPYDQVPSVISLILICSAAMMLAFVAGFVSLLPGGAGVRELVLTALLEPSLGAGPAVVAAILARLIQLGVESILAAVVWCLFLPRYREAGRTPAAETEV
jgi:uncharacterized membrane protein YbhN (UPF0104 family)